MCAFPGPNKTHPSGMSEIAVHTAVFLTRTATTKNRPRSPLLQQGIQQATSNLLDEEDKGFMTRLIPLQRGGKDYRIDQKRDDATSNPQGR